MMWRSWMQKRERNKAVAVAAAAVAVSVTAVWPNLPKGSYIPRLLDTSDVVAGFIYMHPKQAKQYMKQQICLIILAAEKIVQSQADNSDQEQLANELEKIVSDGTDDNGDGDLSEHGIEIKHFSNGTDGLRQKKSRTQLQTIVDSEANLEINITIISANTLPHHINEQDELGGNG
ncbi:MAG: hypothetical protein EZS28_008974 [Streblomastix strix]|uniref:Uncharacterized protein n=1 Tax=Streblomastix strix TaxID=222440 RepID=A0A5J4WKN6_9EUKA|nr:MAG: hypothetical protein EZS28_008974 [Streblomastix strix]